MENKTHSENTIERPPIIAVMGHIDHGKSALLDYIRKSNVVAGEAGGITQHISAYEVVHKSKNGDKKITFLDTPGHAAFTAMRHRGANIADIAILIISAEEGPKPQTLEALESIKKSGIPFIVAINKIDKPGANIEKTKTQLIENAIYIEGYGGDIPWAPISAKTGQGVPELLDMVLLIAEMEELQGDAEKPAEGYILETKLDAQKGVCTTLIIKDGSMKAGSFIASEDKFASIRTLENFLGETVSTATFSSPVQIVGFKEIPNVGAEFKIVSSKKEAEKMVEEYKEIIGSEIKNKDKNISEKDSSKVIVPLIIKADVLGTIEAIQNEIGKLVKKEDIIKSDRIILKTIHTGVGNITENDIQTAGGDKNTLIVGFNVKVDRGAKDLAEKNNIKIENFDIIYKLTEWLEEQIINKTPKIVTEKVIGKAKILKIFNKTKNKQVIGGKVTEGAISVNANIKISRRDFELEKGKILGLQTQKIEVKEVREGDEFGSMIEAKKDLAPGDYIEAYILIEE
ncbi:translation initiation factor IF-2 [Candidatus Campbellbacteria bacterium RIFCSPLOWO2_01_FULL_34_15]|uniref:Translation initiation factor IF-2 n=2 Tax=Candidatus Campbelliibacteriota TaxID=1752727 RepID=A0A1F5EP82_9BACT|nr:MAG: translation initiation factor IF-2 [Candidatus Campbellbacteria bacterium RIFCSPLOWO2_01_FULL_34_15]OGD69367.1 MAG: translation initiation factor IF-2 [Candidatus Campbellbacteria bacterium RIFCSPHIGHO2_01_FULL_34_10]